MSKTDDLIHYLTRQFVGYIDTPKEQRRSRRKEAVREHWSVRWFGMLPLSLRVWLDSRRRQRRQD